MEAAEEIVRQLRLRDIGGIIVIDFIDMVLESNRDLVLRRLTECLGRDRTKHQVAEVTSLGLVQMTRKRVGQGLLEVFSEPCEHCRGRGVIVHTEPVDERRRGGGSVGGSGSGGGGGNGGGGSRRERPPAARSGRDTEDTPEVEPVEAETGESGRSGGRRSRGRRGRGQAGDDRAAEDAAVLDQTQPDVVQPEVIQGPESDEVVADDESPAVSNAVDVVPLEEDDEAVRTDVDVVPIGDDEPAGPHPAGHDLAEGHGGPPIGRARRRRAASRPAGPPS
jgi:ribonuclease E